MKKDNITTKQFIERIAIISIFLIACTFLIMCIFNIDWTMQIISNIIGTISPILYGIALAYLTNFIYVKVLKVENKLIGKLKSADKIRLKHNKAINNIGIFISEAIVIGFIVVIMTAILPSLIDTATMLISNLPDTLSKISDYILGFVKDNKLLNDILGSKLESLETDIQKWIVKQYNIDGKSVVNTAMGVVSTTLGSVVNFIVTFVTSVMLLGSKDKMLSDCSKVIKAVFGPKISPYVFEELKLANTKFSGFFLGKIVDSIIIGIIVLITALVMHIDYAMLIAMLIAVTNVVPIIGPFIGGIPSVIIVCGQSPILGLYWAIAVIIIQQIDGNIIGPKCIGNSTNISSFWILTSLIVFGAMFGFMGMIIGVPLFTVIYDIISKLVNHKLRKDKSFETNDDDINENSTDTLEKNSVEHH